MNFDWFQPKAWTLNLWSITSGIFWWIFDRLPLISGLRLCSWNSFKIAFKEFFFFWLLSSLPVFFAITVNVASKDNFPSGLEFWEITKSTIRWGEVFVYINALTAPGLYVLYKFARDTKTFPNAYGILLWSIFILLISAVLYSRGTPTTVTMKIGFALYLAALLLRYLALVYDLLRVNFPEETRKQENKLVKSMEGFRGT